MMEDLLLSSLAGFAGGLAVFIAARLRVRLYSWAVKKAKVEIIHELQKGAIKPGELSDAKNTYRVVLLTPSGKVKAEFDTDDSQAVRKLRDKTELALGEKIQVFKNGKFHSERVYSLQKEEE